MTAKLSLAVYCRVSSDEQRTGGNIHRQIEQAGIELKRLGVFDGGKGVLYSRSSGSSLADQYFIDEAYNLEEIREGTAFFHLLQLCKDGSVNAIYVDNIDRIFRARSHSVRGQIMDLIEEHEVQILTPTGPVNSGLVLQFMSAIGAEDKKQTLRKLHIGKKFKVQNNGRPPNGRAFWGYDFDKSQNAWSIVPSEAQAIRWAVAMASGQVTADMPTSMKLVVEKNTFGVSDKDVISALELAGVNLLEYFKRNNFRIAALKNPQGRLPRNWLTNIYRDDRYTGRHVYHLKQVTEVGKKGSSKQEREAIAIEIPPIVSSEEWALAKQARLGRACVTPRHAVQEYLLQGHAYCGSCGAKMGVRARHNDFYKSSTKSIEKNVAKYYVCQSKQTAGRVACDHRKHHGSDAVDKLVWERIEMYLKTDVIDRIHQKKKSTELLQSEINQLKADLQFLHVDYKKLDIERNNFVSLLGRGVLSEEDWMTQKNRLEVEKKKLDKAVKQVQECIRIQQKKVVAAHERINPLDKVKTFVCEDMSFENKKSIVYALLERVVIYPDQRVEVLLKS
ncbi:recombinase family protein [Bdellovibrio sp. KM01]|uniref:recombinase family protein n=1 Tax=Bdellovibrio sp. KM01 TaxID=2748865 RepID=UPI0015EA938A|nr:recombinase family protein [Bdellovibrio sp. KM01]QLY24903.1 recombinase zinc beta ribbon domain-containing protein [Bdellovibrio sp. KM01]